MFGYYFKRLWQHPITTTLDVESFDRPLLHRRMIEEKPVLKAHMAQWYLDILHSLNGLKKCPEGIILELGSGAGFIEDFIPNILKTDAIKNPLCHEIQDACRLSYSNESVRCIILIGVFHHLSNPRGFLNEANRVLAKGGKIIMIEPSNTFPQKLLCSILDHYEYFDTKQVSWEKNESLLMKEANLALTWIVFFRDRNVFEKEFPNLSIEKVRYHSLLLMLLSGGMTYKSMIPNFMIPMVKGIDRFLAPMMHIIGTSMTIEIEKKH